MNICVKRTFLLFVVMFFCVNCLSLSQAEPLIHYKSFVVVRFTLKYEGSKPIVEEFTGESPSIAKKSIAFDCAEQIATEKGFLWLQMQYALHPERGLGKVTIDTVDDSTKPALKENYIDENGDSYKN